MMGITILYNLDKNFKLGREDVLSFQDYITTVYDIEKTLKKIGYKTKLEVIHEENYTILKKIKTDFFFNLCYGIGELPNTEYKIPEVLEKLKIPFSGAGSKSIFLGSDKLKSKKIFVENNIPSPSYQIIKSIKSKLKTRLSFPLIVKPVKTDGSIGIQNNSVVNNSLELWNQVDYVLKTYHQPALVEEYIDGREIRITILGNHNKIEFLTHSELVFSKIFDQKRLWKIDNFDSKNEINSWEYKNTHVSCPAKLSPAVRKKIEYYSKIIWRKFHGSGIARLDIRLKSDTPYFLEINFNPGIGKDDAAFTAAKKAGYSYSSFIQKIINIGLTRDL
ncbi:hypothetical protein A2773_04845 [Candidatus Gottesmanbacteria bacterium RIFCSPHIGHO2_01_FULL_39_10]|uniref:ATP-grasp domain-containing protein n=1 Tax=Candidatus Gottesmanbacteria bacterium RIFCSPHIGHO2_01_FULL_39_10 TaxID=1798375 RepID=A0A1F5ZS75_9BACT|nr:MAG: hypothetical protein A2773_04845 [Candidatus Gottesmanbacteria bacterium RIFCSPHIGHO2_01_FULL_39_10]